MKKLSFKIFRIKKNKKTDISQSINKLSDFLINFIETQKQQQRISDPSTRTGLDDVYLFDFKMGYMSDFGHTTLAGISPAGVPSSADGTITLTANVSLNSHNEQSTDKPIIIPVKPIDVLHELETVPTPFSCELLDEKLFILKEKEKLITQHYTKHEVTALIQRLENRKKYAEFRIFFEQFQNTTEEKINKLTETYKLEMHKSDLFVPEFPDVAIRIMKEYCDIS